MQRQSSAGTREPLTVSAERLVQIRKLFEEHLAGFAHEMRAAQDAKQAKRSKGKVQAFYRDKCVHSPRRKLTLRCN